MPSRAPTRAATPPATRLRPVVRWNGGKTRLLKHLLPALPPHRTYVEAFGGGLALFLAKKPSPVEIINDLNTDLITLYRCAQFHLEPLLAEIQFTLTSRQNLADLRTQPGLTDLQRAARYLILNRTSFGGAGTHYAVSKKTAQPSRAATLATLRALNARLDKTSIENLPFERLFKLYDSPQTLWFLDPPYLDSDAAIYTGWNEAQMRHFHSEVSALQGPCLITVDDSPLNRSLWAKDHLTEITTRNGCTNQRTHGNSSFKELMIERRMQSPCKALKKPAQSHFKQAA
ncbi:MAG: DNA adenine methylase [Prosthecobacter sp.]|nr:DNA adenine methylase [Prosthecobacter sp.]